MNAFDRACSLVETVLDGTMRAEIVARVSDAPDLSHSLLLLRDCMRSDAWKAGACHVDLGDLVKDLDSRTRSEGFHALHDWDGKADRVNEDTIPIDVLNYLIDRRGDDPADRILPAVLLDYHFFYVLGLLSLRAWDEASPDENLDRIDRLLTLLQGSNGSGQQFARTAETLILIATAHYELADRAYDVLLERARTLNRTHKLRMAIVHAASMGSHLRFGLEVTYGRDTVLMRDDNGVDYRWLCFALSILAHEYGADGDLDGMHRAAVVEGLLNGLTPDARAFVGEPPSSLAPCALERTEFGEFFGRHRADLLAQFELHRPTDDSYSPLSFFFNFSHNVLKGTVVDALLRGKPWDLAFDDLLTAVPREPRTDAAKRALATTLMAYARESPDTIRGRLSPVIVYDPRLGRQAFARTMRKIQAKG